MAAIYCELDNSRGGIRSGANGHFCHFRGWNAGVRIRRHSGDGPITFSVFMTAGSNGYGRETFLGTVTDTPEGPVWTPADKADES